MSNGTVPNKWKDVPFLELGPKTKYVKYVEYTGNHYKIS